MSTCDEPCDGCPNRAEHHLCDACCHDEVDAIQKENRELWEKLEWQAACTKALMESQERLAAELKEAREWAKERSEFAAAETEHANRWSVRAHKAEAEVERLRGLLSNKQEEYTQDDVNHMTDEMIALRKDYEKMAYRRGAEAMREAAMGAAWHAAAMGLHKRIKEMPVPEDRE